MARYEVEKTFQTQVDPSPKAVAVAEMFGVGLEPDRKVTVVGRCTVEIEAGQVVYITGGSGVGKSLVLRLITEQLEGAVTLEEQNIAGGKPLVDCFAGDLEEALKWLSLAGLSDAHAMLRRPEELSDGQRYRFRLALALAQQPAFICIDEFCNTLDRITAAVVSSNVRKFARMFDTTFLVATSHDDIVEDLNPDVVVIKHFGSDSDVYYPGRRMGA